MAAMATSLWIEVRRRADGGIGGAAVLEGAQVGGDDFGCPLLGAAVGHPGGEVAQIRPIGPPRVRRHRIGQISDQVIAERRFARC